MSFRLPEKPRYAVAGATGAVGREFLALFEERQLPWASMKLLASARSAGKRLPFCGTELEVETLEESSFEDVDVAFFSCGGDQSRRFAQAATASGCLVVDNSSAFRMDPEVPLIVPEVNAKDLFDDQGALRNRLIANPNCSTIILCVALAPIHAAFGLERIVVSTYQAASGAGEKGMRALIQDSTEALAQPGIRERGLLDFDQGQQASTEVFGHPLAFNLVPQIDVFVDQGRTREELKMVLETRKIFGLPDLPIEATCVRVPLLRSHAESVSIETRDPVDLDLVRRRIQEAPGLELVDDPATRAYPMPSLSSGRDAVLVGRLRPSGVFARGLSCFLSGDQLLKGAALNGLQIVQALAQGQ